MRFDEHPFGPVGLVVFKDFIVSTLFLSLDFQVGRQVTQMKSFQKVDIMSAIVHGFYACKILESTIFLVIFCGWVLLPH